MKKDSILLTGLDTHKEFTEVVYCLDHRVSDFHHDGLSKVGKVDSMNQQPTHTSMINRRSHWPHSMRSLFPNTKLWPWLRQNILRAY